MPRLYKDPLTHPSTHATSVHLPSFPMAANRPEEVVFFISGNSCRRHCPVHSSATRASPSHLSSPRTPPSFQEPNPLLDFDREPSPPPNHFVTEAPSATKLAAGDSLHPRRPCDHRKDRLGVADPSLRSDAHEETPFAGDDRRTPRLGSGQRKRREKTSQT